MNRLQRSRVRSQSTTTIVSSAPRAAADAKCGHVAAGGRIPALDGFRLVLCLAMVHLHAVTMHIPFTHDAEMARIQREHWLAYHAFLAVDGFFVLSGFLLGGQLLRGEVGTDSTGLREHMVNRVLRLMVPISIAVAWYCGIMCAGGGPGYAGLMRSERLLRLFDTMLPGAEHANGQCSLWWATLLHAQNFAPYNGCMAHLWQVRLRIPTAIPVMGWLDIHVTMLDASPPLRRLRAVAHCRSPCCSTRICCCRKHGEGGSCTEAAISPSRWWSWRWRR